MILAQCGKTDVDCCCLPSIFEHQYGFCTSSRYDAALTCPEPWTYVNHSMKLLEVNVCHLTQFAFFFSFYAQNGLVLLDKNYSSK